MRAVCQLFNTRTKTALEISTSLSKVFLLKDLFQKSVWWWQVGRIRRMIKKSKSNHGQFFFTSSWRKLTLWKSFLSERCPICLIQSQANNRVDYNTIIFWYLGRTSIKLAHFLSPKTVSKCFRSEIFLHDAVPWDITWSSSWQFLLSRNKLIFHQL